MSTRLRILPVETSGRPKRIARRIYKTRTFKIVLIVLLIVLAVRLRGEDLTVGALLARVADFILDLFADAVRENN